MYFVSYTLCTIEYFSSFLRHLGHITGNRSYYLKGAGAQLEEALVRYTVDRLLDKGFKNISVPDIIKPVPFVSSIWLLALLKI